MHDWPSWAVPALMVLLVPIIASIWRAGERLALLEQESRQHRTEINANAVRTEVLDTKLDVQVTTLYRVEGKLDTLLEGFKALIRFPLGPPKP